MTSTPSSQPRPEAEARVRRPRWRKAKARTRYLRRRVRTMRPSRSGLAFAAIGLAVVLSLPALFFVRVMSVAPEQVVATYLDAVRDGDVDRALDLSAWRPRGESARFLTAEALDDGWTFTDVTETRRTDERATVTARLSGADGGESATAKFDLIATDTGWSLREPFASLRFGTRSLGFAEANGVGAETGPAAKSVAYLFFPGRYEFYSDAVEQLDLGSLDMVLAPGEDTPKPDSGQPDGSGVIDLGEPGLTESGLKGATKAVGDHIDICAESAKLAPRACPFGTIRELERSLGYEYLDFEDISWTVKKYPEIKAAATENGFAVTATKPGRVVFTATGIEEVFNRDTDEFEPVGEHKVKVSCGMDLTSMVLLLKPEGEWQAVHGVSEAVSADPATFAPAADVETCLR